MGYNHYFINHSLHFVDPIDPSIHTNDIERARRSFKNSISHVKRSLSDKTIDSFIDTFHFQTFISEESLYEVFIQILFSVTNDL